MGYKFESHVSFMKIGGGRVWRRCRVSYVTGASSWYWLTVVKGLLSLQQVRVEGNVFISSVSSLPFLFRFLPYPSLSSPLLSLLSLFFLSLGDNSKWSTRVDMSLNPNTINQSWNDFYCDSPVSTDLRRAFFCYWQKYVYKVLVYHLED